MNVIETEIKGLLIVEPDVFYDDRGFFCETYNQKRYFEMGITANFVQDNQSASSYGVVRGLHFQLPPYTQAKLVSCLVGRVLDVAVDLRAGSPTYGKHVAVELSQDNHRQFFIPKGFAHGFSVLSPKAIFTYKCDELYHPEADGGISLLDKSLGIDWQVAEKDMILSPKDLARKCLSELKIEL